MDREVVYVGRDNTINLLLKADGSAEDLSGVTHMALVFSGVTVSSVGRTSWFDWSSGTTGQLILKLGGTTVTPGAYEAELLVYDLTHTSGIMWGKVTVKVEG